MTSSPTRTLSSVSNGDGPGLMIWPSRARRSRRSFEGVPGGGSVESRTPLGPAVMISCSKRENAYVDSKRTPVNGGDSLM